LDSLLRAGEAMRGFIFLLFNIEEIAIDIKIATAILVMDNYNQFLSSPCHQLTSVIEFKTTSFLNLNIRNGSETYTYLIINKLLRDERRSLNKKLKMGGKMKFDSKHPP
jgi:hypothetical protein